MNAMTQHLEMVRDSPSQAMYSAVGGRWPPLRHASAYLCKVDMSNNDSHEEANHCIASTIYAKMLHFGSLCGLSSFELRYRPGTASMQLPLPKMKLHRCFADLYGCVALFDAQP